MSKEPENSLVYRLSIVALIAGLGVATMKDNYTVPPIDKPPEVAPAGIGQEFVRIGGVVSVDGFFKPPIIADTTDGRVSRLILDSNEQLEKITAIMEKYPTVFTKQDFQDLKIYYPIYLAIANHWKIDWKLLWVVHFYETNCSNNPFTEKVRHAADYDLDGKVILSNSLFGAMQRDIKIYPDALVGELFAGLEYLKKIPTRYKSDHQEINFAAWKLSRDLKRANGNTRIQLNSYSHEDFAAGRWQLLNLYNVIFHGIS